MSGAVSSGNTTAYQSCLVRGRAAGVTGADGAGGADGGATGVSAAVGTVTGAAANRSAVRDLAVRALMEDLQDQVGRLAL